VIAVQSGGGVEVRLPREEYNGLAYADPSSLEGVNDIVQLSQLNEAAILHSLRVRYWRSQVYTCISTMLLSVNPFQLYPIYGEEYLTAYRQDTNMPPHIYGIAQRALTGLIKSGSSQAVIISGESGAGKTEAAKLVLRFIAYGQPSNIEAQILSSDPIIEAFGNAKTVRNNNSSRFGKWIQLLMKQEKIEGLQITNYLLEKSRVIPKSRRT